MINARDAITIALTHVRDLFATSAGDQPRGSDFRLEEVERREDDSWRVTVSFLRPGPGAMTAPAPAPAISVLGVDAQREFKVVSLTASGQVRSVAIRPIALSS